MKKDIQPVNDIETEQMLLGCILSNPVTIEDIPYLLPEHFYRGSHHAIFSAMQNVYKREKRIDIALVTDELRKEDKLEDIETKGFDPYLRTLLNAAYVFGNIDWYGRIVYNLWRHRYLGEIANIAASGAFYENDAVFEELEKMFRVISTDVSRVSEMKDHRDMIGDFVGRVSDRIDRAPGISTGFAWLDTAIGRLSAENPLTVVAARPGGGKTAFALNLIDSALKQRKPDGSGHTVAFISLEMSDDMISKRWIAQNAGVNTRDLRDGTLDDDQWERFVEASTSLQNLPGTMFTLRPRGNLLPPVRQQLMALRRDHGLDMIVLDYLQKCKMAEGRDRQEKRIEVEEAVIWCRDIAIEFGVPFVCLAQLNRESEHSARPQLSHLKEASAIEQEADNVILIWKQTDADNPNPPNWNATLIVAKNRDGMQTDVSAHYVGAYTQFRAGSLADEM